VLLGRDIAEGLAVIRHRRRGSALEAVLCDVLVPDGAAAAASAVVKKTARAVGADYLIRVSPRLASREGFIRLPRNGPLLVQRPVCAPDVRPMRAWDLTLGDIELF
jgi:hypothetical protein